MNGLTISRNGRRYELTPNMEVLQVDHGPPTAVGRWDTSLAATANRPNHVRFNVNGDESVIPAHYSFTTLNQLVMTVPAAEAGLSADSSFTYRGKIVIDDTHDVVYRLFDANNALTGKTIIVYGDLGVTADATALEITLAERGDTTLIRGSIGLASFRHDTSLTTLDKLVFRAITVNGSAFTDADIAFVGEWTLKAGTAVFTARAQGSITSPDVELEFAANFGIVTAGLELRVKRGEIERAAFLIAGVIEKNNASTTWSIALGKTGKTYTFEAAIDHHRLIESGPYRGTLDLSGKATLQVPDGAGGVAKIAVELSITAKWKLNNSDASLELEIQVEWATNADPKIRLSGKFKWQDRRIVFSVSASDGGFALELEVTSGDFMMYFKIIFGSDRDISFNWMISYTWNFNSRRIERTGVPQHA